MLDQNEEQKLIEYQQQKDQERIAELRSKQAARKEAEEWNATPDPQRQLYAEYMKSNLSPEAVAQKALEKTRQEYNARQEMAEEQALRAEVEEYRKYKGHVPSQIYQGIKAKYAQQKAERLMADERRALEAEAHDSPLERAMYSLPDEARNMFTQETEKIVSDPFVFAKAEQYSKGEYQKMLYSQFMAEVADLAQHGKRHLVGKLRQDYIKRGMPGN